MQLVIHASSFAAVVTLAGTILLLIVGAQILSWYWLVVLFAAGLLASAYRSRGQLRSSYQVAQTIDRQLGLHDALSTAHYFGQHPDYAASRDFVDEQRRSAEDVARSADLQRGMPFMAPRTAYVNVALIAVAFGMFGLRYGIRRSLDLGSPLVHIRFDGLFGNSPQTAETRRAKFPGSDGKDQSAPMTAWQTQTDARDPAADAARQSAEDPQASNAAGAPDSDAKADSKGTEQMPPGTNPLDSGEKGDPAAQGEQNSNSSAGADSKQGQQQQGAQKEGQNGNPSNGSNENASLGSKLRDALSNLMAKMKPQSKQGGGRSNDASQSSGQRPEQRGERQDGEPKSPGQEQAEASANSQSQGEQQQGGTQQASQGKSDGKSNSQPNSPDGKSGIGKQDGDKAAREAAELAAMGKLSEIIGKRAANISGEMMVEVSPGKQQLKTQYSQQSATHTDAGGEINRDEVPLAYQQYVQQYFAQIRKQPAGKGKPASSLPPDSKAKTTPSSLQ
ncbi:MAG TPA: hypothetical protein VFW44_18020 [Bryobacteraceae bacterium]|nr:hypothetical protein [Bryobacteraceae bacterium]